MGSAFFEKQHYHSALCCEASSVVLSSVAVSSVVGSSEEVSACSSAVSSVVPAVSVVVSVEEAVSSGWVACSVPVEVVAPVALRTSSAFFSCGSVVSSRVSKACCCSSVRVTS